MMKKFFRTIIIVFTFLMLFTISCYASDSDYDVRVRIRKPRKFNEQAQLKGYGSINVYNISKDSLNPIFVIDEYADILMDTYYNNKFLAVEANDSSAVIGPHHLKITNYEFGDFESARNEANSLTSKYKIEFYPVYNGRTFEIYAGTYTSVDALNNLQVLMTSAGINHQVVDGKDNLIVVYNKQNEIEFMYHSNVNIYFTSPNTSLACNSIIIDGSTYRGMMSFMISEGKLVSVNKVMLKYYLYGVVPNEVSPSWPIEAIKAQVLAARTYAVSGIRPKSDYDMQDNQNSQVYYGYNSEYKNTNKAVDDTDGQMIYYNNKLITAFYHSTSGGCTEDSENIWFDAYPYLRGVDDPYSNISPYTEWTSVMSKDELTAKVKESYPEVNEVYSIQITEKSKNHRVIECVISADTGNITLRKEKIRTVLGYSILLSNWFDISTDNAVFLISKSTYDIESGSDKKPGSELDGGNTGLLDDTSGSLLDPDSSLLDSPKVSESTQFDSGINPNVSSIETSSTNPDKTPVVINGMSVIGSNGVSVVGNGEINVISSNGISSLNGMPSVYKFNGRGWGHSVGMSQYGACGMAEQGFTYDQIIKHYYTGVEIK